MNHAIKSKEMKNIKDFNGTWEYFTGGTLTIGTEDGNLKSFTTRNTGYPVLTLELTDDKWSFDDKTGLLTITDTIGQWIIQIVDEETKGQIRIEHGDYVEAFNKISDEISLL